MAIPDYQTIMLPLLIFLKDQTVRKFRETVDALAEKFNLTDDERKELLPSGQQAIFDNRMGWARTYLKKAGLIEAPKRGFFKITDRGLKVLAQNPPVINVKYLDQFEEFREFRAIKKDPPTDPPGGQTPEEVLESAYENLRSDLASDLLNQIKSSPPSLFEKTVVELLVKMGYGGSRKDAGKAVGKTKDEGIDGIIKEDRLGLDTIYIQAKRWENVVSRPEIQKFAGALQGQRAKKGIFITTSYFSKEAHEYAERIDTKIILIDGDQLAQLMIDNNVGVTPGKNYEVKKIDSDYFIED
ncbi:restriction endonuclease [Thermodesulfobacteriota bacterium]